MRCLLLATAVLSSAVGPLFADPGLDLVLLVDRSASMAVHRDVVPQAVTMAFGIVARNSHLQRVRHRVAVIGFASSARVELPLTIIRGADLPRLPAFIGPRGDTDVLAAFDVAGRLFDAIPAAAERRRAIVVVTDGVPDVRGADMADYRARLRRLVAERFSRSGTVVEILLLTSRPELPLWRDLGVDVHHAGDATDLLARTHGVVTRLAGTRAAESTPSKTGAPVETLVVPPYLDVIVFDIVRASPDAAVEVIPFRSTTPLRDGVGGVELVKVGDMLATLVIPRPVPGEWKIRKRSADARVRILSQQFFPRGVLVQPAAARQYDRLELVYQLFDSARPLTELPGYSLAVDLVLGNPAGVFAPVAMQRETNATFRNAGGFDLALPGRYWTDIRVTTTDSTGRRVEILRDRWSGFLVAPATPIDCRVSAAGAMPWWPMTTRVECAHADGRPFDVGALIAGSPADLFRGQLSRDGRPAEAMLNLRYAGQGVFAGLLRGTSHEGSYQLRMTVDPSRLRAPYNIRFHPPQLAFVRRTDRAWLAIPAIAVMFAAAIFIRRATGQ